MRWYGRLRRSSDIAFVRRRGRHASLACFSAYAVRAPHGPPSVAVTVSKAVGNAVTRNLVRRRIRGALDGLPPGAQPAIRVLFVAKPAAAGASFRRLADDVIVALTRLGAP